MRAPFLQRLKEATAEEHRALEAVMPLETIAASLDTYRVTLTRMYGFYKPVEDALIAYAARFGLPLDLSERTRAHLILTDLLATGKSGFALPLADRPAIRSQAEALGVLYVVEGSTLGGRLIARTVAGRLGLDRATGCAFFTGYGDRAGLMWRSLCDILNDGAREGCAADEIVAAAAATFVSFRAWVQRTERILA